MQQARKGSVLLATALASFLTASMSSALTIALPQLDGEFSMGAVILNWKEGAS